MTKKNLQTIVTRVTLLWVLMTSGCILNAQQTFSDIDGISYRITSTNPNTVEVIYKPGGYAGIVTIPASIIYMDRSYSVTGIGDAAFSGCSGLTGVNLLNTITRIGDGAFANCSELQSVNIPEAVTYIGIGAFAECNKLTNITVQGSNQSYSAVNGILFNKTQSTLIQYPTGKAGTYDIPSSVSSIGSHAFARCSRLTSITIPSTVTHIEDGAFANCTGLTIVNFNAISCSYMGKSGYAVFMGCSSLGTINIGDNVQSIPDYAFSDCSGLRTITIPNSVTSIGSYAFDKVTLNTLYVNAVNPPYIYSNTFPYYSSAIPVYVPCGMVGTYQSDQFWGKFTNIQENTPKYNIIVLSNNNTKGTAAITQPNICGYNMVTIAATPFSGYDFVKWNDGNTQNPRTFVITQDTTFTAQFATVYHVSVSTNNPSTGNVTGGGDFIENTTTTLLAIPNQGYRFVQWNDGNTQNPRIITVTQHITYTATFDVANNGGSSGGSGNGGNTDIESNTITTFAIYPNPAIDNVTVILPDNISHATFCLYDLQGKAVIKKDINNEAIIAMDNLASGIYIYNIITEKEHYTGKLIRK